MKILHVTNTLEEGGVESLLLGLTIGMQKQGHDVTVLSLRPGKTSFCNRFRQANIHVHSCGAKKRLYSLSKMYRVVRVLLKNDFDIVHAHLFPSQYYVAIAAIVCGKWKRRRIAIGTTEHGMINSRRTKPWLRGLERMIYRQFDFIVGVSSTVSENLMRWLGKPMPIVTIENGIDISTFRAIPSQARVQVRERLGISESLKVLIMVARFYEAKDHDTLIRAMALLSPDYHLILVGSGPTQANCEMLAKELEVAERVHFVGYTDLVAEFIAAADVGVLSSYHEGCPMSLVEYMVYGLPIVASDIESIRLLVGDAGYLFPAGNAEELAQCVTRLTIDSEHYNQMRQISYTRADSFELTRTVQKYLQLYTNTAPLCKNN